MSFASTHAALQVSNVTAGQKLVLAAIASFERAGKAWPSIATIAKRCSMGARTVQRHIASLISLGYITRTYRAGHAAVTRLFIGQTPAKLAPPPMPNWHPESGISESVNETTAAPPPSEPLPAAVSPPLLFSEIPEQPKTATEPLQAEVATYPLAEVTQAVVEPSMALVPEATANEVADVQADTLTVDVLAEVPAQLLHDLGEVRKNKKKPAKVTKTEADMWFSEAQKAGWTMQQVIMTMVLRGWSRFEASWVEHVPQQVAPGQTKVWEPEPHTPASPEVVAAAKARLAELRAQIVADSARKRVEQVAVRR